MTCRIPTWRDNVLKHLRNKPETVALRITNVGRDKFIREKRINSKFAEDVRQAKAHRLGNGDSLGDM